MAAPPDIFLRPLYYARQARTTAAARAALLAPVLASLDDRLSLIARDFEVAAILDAHHLAVAPMPILQHKTQTRIGISGLPDWDMHAKQSAYTNLFHKALPMPSETLPLAPASCDLVLALWGLHIVNDLPGLLTQIRVCLKPDGVLLAALPGGETLAPLRSAFLQAEAALESGSSPHIHPSIDIRQLGALLQRAGFALPVVDKEILPIPAQDGASAMQWLQATGEGNCLRQRRKRFLRRTTYAKACAVYDSAHKPAIIEVQYLLGWAPAPGQPKPLRPGSARMGLADALGRKEQKLPS